MISILPFRHLAGRDLVNAKVATLALLAEAGVPVPEAYVIGECHVEDWRRRGWLAADHQALTDAAAIWASLPRLPDRLAVRSAFDEDGNDASNAGAYLTRLDVADDPEELPTAIEAVWRTAPASCPRRQVIVMRQVRAVWAGVAATGGDYSDDLIEYAEGDTTAVTRGDAGVKMLTVPRLELSREHVPPTVSGVPFAEELAHVLRRLRRVLGPGGANGWDVEWAYDGTVCWVLQARPLLAPLARSEEITAANLRESYPDPPSPFTLSVLSETLGEAWAWFTEAAGGFGASRRWVFVRAGRPYTNQSALVDLLRHLGLPPNLATDSAGGSTEAESSSPLRLLARPSRTGRLLWRLGAAPWATRKAVRDLDALARSLSDDPAVAVRTILAGERVVQRGMTPLVSLLAVVLAACETAGGPLPDTSGTPNDQMWSELEAMGQSVANDPAEFDALTGGQPTGELGVEWKRWLDRFGHRGTWELDFAEPRYREDPSLILSYLATRGPTPRDRPAVGGSNCLAAIPRWVGARLIMQRETLRDQSVRLWEDCRRVLIHAERRWIDQGRLPEVGSLWFCTYEEVLAMCHGKFTMDETELERRREDHERDRRCQPPLVVRSDRDPCREDLAPGSGDQLSGLVLTGGRAEGRATILRSPDEMVPADGPRIAVVPVMSAGWVPAIASAEGVVVESGGLLSHGSILLRELGRCAVTNAHGAQSLINDGDWVSIDGESGTVHVCRRVAAEPSDDRGGNGGH